MRDTFRPDALPASPSWVPSRLCAGSRGLARLVLCLAGASRVALRLRGCTRHLSLLPRLASPRGFSLFLASSRTLCGFSVSCFAYLPLFNVCSAAHSVQRIPCCLSNLAALLGICFFRSQRSRLSLCLADCLASLYSFAMLRSVLRSAALFLFCCWFLAGSLMPLCTL